MLYDWMCIYLLTPSKSYFQVSSIWMWKTGPMRLKIWNMCHWYGFYTLYFPMVCYRLKSLFFLIYSYYYHFLNRAGRRKPSRIRVVRLEQEGSSYNFGDSKKKGVYPSPLVSFHFRRSGTNTSPNSFESRPGFSPLTNYVTTTEQTWLTNMVYAPLM